MTEPIYEAVSKGIRIENSEVLLEINCVDGGRLTRIFDKENRCELLWENPRNLYASRYYNANYDDLTAGGVEEAFPTVESCTANGYSIPYFGEIWANRWELSETGDDSATLVTFSPIWPAKVSKRFSLKRKELKIEYTIENLGLASMDFVFGFHPGLAIYEDSELYMPEGEYDMYQHPGLEPGEIRAFSWPVYEGTDLSKTQSREDRVVYNFLACPSPGGCYGLRHPEENSGIQIEFDEKLFRCLSIWPVYGSKKGHRCMLTEAFTSWPAKLSEAMERGLAVRLERGQTLSTVVKYTVGL